MKLSDKAKKLIDGKNFVNVATLMPDGSPQVAPVWVDRDGDTILLNATVNRQRYRNLNRDPRVAIAIYDQSNPYSNVLIRGRATEITKTGAEEHIDRLNMKYTGSPEYPNHSSKDARVLIKIQAKRIAEM